MRLCVLLEAVPVLYIASPANSLMDALEECGLLLPCLLDIVFGHMSDKGIVR